MAVIDTSLLSRLNGKTSSTASTSSDQNSAEAIQSRFITMLTAQLQAQDPLSPMDTSQMTSQMAQISTVSGITQLNQTINQLMSAQTSSQALTAANLIGHKVLTAGNTLPLQNGAAVGAIDLAGAADTVQVDIVDGNGRTVDSLKLNNATSGLTYFSWDGTDSASNQLADGNYTFKVKALKDATAIEATAMSFQAVNAISLNQGTTQVILGDGSKVDLSKVQQVA